MRWEYKTIYIRPGEEDIDLDECGNMGWELVSIVIPEGELPKAYFKRPTEELPPAIIAIYTDHAKGAQDMADEIRQYLSRYSIKYD